MSRVFLRDRYLAAGLVILFGSLLAPILPAYRSSFAETWARFVAEPVFLVLALAALALTPQAREREEERWFWRLIGAGLLLWLAGVGLRLGSIEWAPAKVAHLLSYLALALAADLRPHLAAGWRAGSAEFPVGVAASTLLVAALIAYFLMVPAFQRQGTGLESARIACLALDILLTLRFLHHALRSHCLAWRPVYLWLSAGFAAAAVGDALTLAIQAGQLRLPFGTPLDALWWLPFLAIIAARRLRFAQVHGLVPSPSPAPGSDEPRTDVGEMLLLYAFALPAMHLIMDVSGLPGEHATVPRATVVLATLLGFLMLAGLLHRRLQRSHRALSSELRVLVLNEQLVQTQKMEAIGRLAGGLAHDFNNLLMVVSGHAELLRTRLGSGSPAHDDLEAIGRAANGGAALTRKLLAFSRDRAIRTAPLDLGACVRDSEHLLRRLVGERVRLEIRAAGTLRPVETEGSEILQILLNLVTNARDAMPEGGSVTIETREVFLPHGDPAATPPCRPGEYVLLEVRDTGPGIAPAIRQRIFEPFFTTRATGTGLGLAVVYAIATKGDGHVRVRDGPSGGTVVSLLFPPSSGKVLPPEAARVPGTKERIEAPSLLLVEDQAPVRATVRRMLEILGYRVTEAGSGAEAIELARRSRRPPDVLLTDIVMPDMRGPRVAAGVREVHPNVRVLYMSGFVEDSADADLARDVDAEVIQKPFDLETLRRCLENAPALNG